MLQGYLKFQYLRHLFHFEFSKPMKICILTESRATSKYLLREGGSELLRESNLSVSW
jgi:hypothetical protein